MSEKIAIRVEGLSKKYSIGVKKSNNLRNSLGNIFSGKSSVKEDFWALKNLSFEIEKGDVVGIIGKNGAGKSTLLKILSQITRPTEGRIEINGRVASLLEVGTGFHPELTGRENVYLNGTILGMTKKEVKAKFDEIVEFSGVEKFIDTPVKHYSSGMYVRLAFAVAAHLEPEILIIDEVLAVGDAEFQKKCIGKMQDVAGEGRTVLFVSHNMAAVKSLCNKGILLIGGEKVFEGSVSETLEKYNNIDFTNQVLFDTSNYASRYRGPRHIFIREVEFDKSIYSPDSQWSIRIKIGKSIANPPRVVNLAVFIFDGLQNTLYQLSTLFDENNGFEFDENRIYKFQLESLNLSPGIYSVGVWLQSDGFEQDYIDQQFGFEVMEGNIYNDNYNPLIVSIVQKEFDFTII